MSDYLSVTEYARLNGKDPGNIRRLLASGRIEGEKIGNQWIIKKEVAYPADRREKTGKYRNWRALIRFNKIPYVSPVVFNMIHELKNIYGDILSSVILYGSYARGEQNTDSDVDIAIILKDDPPREITDAMIECVAAHELSCGKVLSVIEINQKKYDEWKNILPFYKNIEKEGVALWKAA